LLRIDGRSDDYIVTPEGARIARLDYLFKDSLNVKEAQIIQDQPGGITIVLVRRPTYASKDEAKIRRDVQTWLSPLLDVTFQYVDEIPREANGKFRAVLSRLNAHERNFVTQEVSH